DPVRHRGRHGRPGERRTCPARSDRHTELRGSECYGVQARALLRRLIPPGTTVRVEADPRLDQVDRYGRLLRHPFRGPTNLNLELVRQGAATVWFYDHDRGRYAAELM